MGVAGFLGEVGKAYSQSQAAMSRQHSLDLQEKQNTLSFQQKTLSNYDLLDKILARQTAEATVRGIKLSSPSFEAIERSTLNADSRELKNIDIEKNLYDANIAIEKNNVRKTLYAQLFGDVAETAMSFATLASKMPTKG